MMPILAAIHVTPIATVPVATVLAVVMVLYMRRLAAVDVPRPRRALRQSTMVLGLLMLPLLVEGFSLIDPDVTPRPYALVWLASGFLLFVILVVTAIDIRLSWSIHRRDLAHLRAERDAALRALGRRRPRP
ncbi:MAG: hypothetical protein ACO3DS_02870 [Phycisphaerales bacterium]|jgi:uncharacterized membrane protein YbhN (UPF0104 family)